MNRSLYLKFLNLLLLLLVLPAAAQEITQSLPLRAGWNAVWLEVEPLGVNGYQKAPQDVFAHPAIEMIATPKPLAATAELFAEAPGSIGVFNQEGWQQWNRADLPGASDLTLVFGNRPYLIRVAAGTPAFSLPITGRVRFFRPTWTADRYNLLGFNLQGSRTFSDFFGPSGTCHDVRRIFRLAADGNWSLVNAGDLMVSNEAYWIFSDGPSTYMGPVAVDFERATSGRLDFSGPNDAVSVGPSSPALELDLREVVFTNKGAVAATPAMELVAVSAGQGSLALFTVSPANTGLAWVRGNQVDSSLAAGSSALGEVLDPGQTRTLTLGAQRNWSTGNAGRLNLYRVRTSTLGATVYLPVTATLSDADYAADATPTPPVSERVGLWVGEIVIDSSTSMVENGAPQRPTAGKTPARIILHDNGTKVRLLSQVTLMQTKSADPSATPTSVLVVDPARIPFYEGVRERNGRKVGVRMESVAFDMPRKLDALSQAALLADRTYPLMTEADLPGFLVTRNVRPPSLREVYALSLDLQGTLAPAGTLNTVSGSLHLDPFHRSNPFRHAYHRDHSAGPFIYRELSIELDPVQPSPDQLRGTYSETIRGLINSNLTLRGHLELRRVSRVASLEGAP